MQAKYKRKRGAAIAESAAAITVLLPTIIMVLFVVLEASHAYLIKNCLSEAAREAARDLSIAYGEDPTIVTSRSAQDAAVFDRIRIYNIVNNSAQFDDPVFNPAAMPPTVSVTVHYTSNQYGLPAFPNPDPLHIASTINIAGASCYRLQ